MTQSVRANAADPDTETCPAGDVVHPGWKDRFDRCFRGEEHPTGCAHLIWPTWAGSARLIRPRVEGALVGLFPGVASNVRSGGNSERNPSAWTW